MGHTFTCFILKGEDGALHSAAFVIWMILLEIRRKEKKFRQEDVQWKIGKERDWAVRTQPSCGWNISKEHTF